MKVFDLLCITGHKFEAWFASEEEYQKQLQQGLLNCPFCGSSEVNRVLSAPRLNRKSNQTAGTVTEDNQPNPAGAQREQAGHELISYILSNTEDVGENFTEEARKIHYGEADERAIRGKASKDEVIELQEEGIEILPLPFLLPPKDSLQ